MAGSVDTHDGLARRLCNETGCRLVSVEYRLAPEHPFPEGLRDACTAVTHVARNSREFGIDPARLGVAGDSAGATLAAAVCQWARDEGGPRLACQLLLCPIMDLEAETPSRHELAEGWFCNRDALMHDLALYCGGADRGDPRLSPLRARSLEDLPPAFIHTAQYDPFVDEGAAYARRLAEAGVAVEGRVHPGMIHFFYCLPRMIPYAQQAAEIAGAQIRFALHQPPPRDRAPRRVPGRNSAAPSLFQNETRQETLRASRFAGPENRRHPRMAFHRRNEVSLISAA